MKAKELMVSDYIIVADDIARVVALSADDRIAYIYPDGTCGVTLEAKPIPLTAEILEKNGFVLIRDFWSLTISGDGEGCSLVEVQKYQDGSFDVCGDNRNEDGFLVADLASLKIHYVHELQHALRLCGIEKEIEL